MDRKAVEIVKEFVGRVSRDFRVQTAILFGSRARDDYLLDSDVDVLLVSEDFRGIEFTSRMARMYDYWDAEYGLEVLCYTPDEFEKKRNQICIVEEAVEQGIAIEVTT